MKKRLKVTVFQVVDADAPKFPRAHWINVEDSAVVLDCSDETVRRLIENGDLQGRKQQAVHGPAGWRWIVPTDDLMRVRKVRKAQGRVRPADVPWETDPE